MRWIWVVLLGGWLAIGALVSWPAFAQDPGGGSGTVREIRIEGIQRIEPETIRSYLTIRAGDPMTRARIDRSLKALFATGLFADVSIQRQGDVLLVRVVENPVINRIVFEGNDQLEDEALISEIQMRPRTVYTRTRVQNDVRRILDIYKRDGRFAVTVDPKVIRRSQNRVDLIFEINEGPATKIRKISFIGNKKFTDRRLRSVIQTQESRWYSFFTGADIFDPDILTFDREQLRKYYLSQGYADFKVVSAVAELSHDRRDFFITFTIDEGPRYRFGEIEIVSGLKAIGEKKLIPQLTVAKGRWYDASEIDTSIRNLTDAVGTLGFAFVEIRPRAKRDVAKRTISVRFDIEEGPRVFVERINITGNIRTLDKVIRRELRLVEGDPFNTAKYRRSRQRVRRLGFFKKVAIKRVVGSAPDKTIINVKVDESSTGSLSVGGGFSSTAGVITQISIRERNLLGKGQDLRAKVLFGTTTQELDLSFTEPYFLNRNLAAGFDLFRTVRKDVASINFDRRDVGFRLRMGFSYNEKLRQNLNYNLRSIKISDVDDDASTFIKNQEGKATTSSIGQSLTYDVRDSRIDPTEGYVISLSNDLAGFGGDRRYLRSSVGGTTYYALTDDWIASINGRFGYIAGFGQGIRINDRYFIGGDSLRGFEVGGIGPRDRLTGDALGGNRFYTASAEMKFPLPTLASFGFTGFVFTDLGSLGSSEESGSDVFAEDSLRASVGVGFGLKTPLGPIRINYTQAVLKEDFDKTELLSFRFGTRF